MSLAFWLFVACAPELPEGPPPAARLPPLDTAWTASEPEVRTTEGTNRRPRIQKVTISPRKIYGDTDVTARYSATDPEGDYLRERWTWFVNGQQVGAGEFLSSSEFSKGDKLQVELTLRDLENEVTRRSDFYDVLNSPPDIDAPPGLPSSLNGYRVRASDPDNDPLTWRVEDGPDELTIDQSGRLSYSAPTGITEPTTWRAKIIAEDTSGEYAAWPLTLNVSPGGPPPSEDDGSGDP